MKESLARSTAGQAPAVEPLEARRLLSATFGPSLPIGSVVPAHILRPADAGAAAVSVDGITPNQIRKAYGFDQVTVGDGSVAADGAGQTIAIVVAYDDPAVQADLAVFDQKFGLAAPPSLRVINQSGGAHLPREDTGWAAETALDVEWAHAIAPAANLLVVEANSDSNPDLVTAVDAARSAPGVSVVSMSWGGGEFVTFAGKEFTGQTDYDPHFTTPPGHNGVTFVAAAGDNGVSGGAGWPASAAGVLSVGGTTLNMASDGTYLNESVWSDTSGGYSTVEPQPSYQLPAQSTGARAVPDVAYAADPNSGFAVYDSIPDQGYVGWQVEGGNSAGTPQWAALVAIANQARTAAGKGALDGPTQVLPGLYGLYNTAGTTTAYSASFHDVVDNTGGVPIPATVGYDVATGLGSPRAPALVTALVALGDAPSNTPTPTPTPTQSLPLLSPSLPASPLTATFQSTPAASVINGDLGTLKLKVINTSGARVASSAATVTIYASSDAILSTDDIPLATLSLGKVNLRNGGSRKLKAKFHYLAGLSGSYDLIAAVDLAGSGANPAVGVTSTQVTVGAPSVQLAATFSTVGPILVRPGHSAGATLTLQNLGNAVASGAASFVVYVSSTPTVDGSALPVAVPAPRKVQLRPGRTLPIKVRFKAPLGRPGGSYFVVVAVTPSGGARGVEPTLIADLPTLPG